MKLIWERISDDLTDLAEDLDQEGAFQARQLFAAAARLQSEGKLTPEYVAKINRTIAAWAWKGSDAARDRIVLSAREFKKDVAAVIGGLIEGLT